MPRGWTFSADPWLGRRAGRLEGTSLCPGKGPHPHPVSTARSLAASPFPGSGWHWASGPWRALTEPQPRPVPRLPQWQVGTCGCPPLPCQTSIALLRTSRDPLKPKPPDLPRGPAQEKVRARGPRSPSLRPPPSFVNHRALYAGGLASGLPAQPRRCTHPYPYIHSRGPPPSPGRHSRLI